MQREQLESGSREHLGLNVETPQVSLRKFRIADAGRLTELVGDQAVSRWTSSIPHPYTIEDAANWINARSNNRPRQALAVDLGELLIGCVSYWPDDDAGVEVGYWIGRPYWGQGLGTRSLRALLSHPRFPREEPLSARVMTENASSRRVLEKCGFICTGTCFIDRKGFMVDAKQYRRKPTEG